MTLELLLDSVDSLDRAEMARLLKRLHHGTRWLQDQLADLTRGHLAAVPGETLHAEPLSLGPCVERAMQIVQPLLDVRGQHVELRIPARPVMVWGDEHLLRRVAVNLLSNAAKYSSICDHIQINVSLDENWVSVEVQDHGEGVRPVDQMRIFNRRVRSSRHAATDAPTGSGLGLSIVKSLVELHHGQVGVHSEAGCGATFWFRLPRLGSRRSNALFSKLGTRRRPRRSRRPVAFSGETPSGH
jgi:signal transduction histidine kinase